MTQIRGGAIHARIAGVALALALFSCNEPPMQPQPAAVAANHCCQRPNSCSHSANIAANNEAHARAYPSNTAANNGAYARAYPSNTAANNGAYAHAHAYPCP